MSATEIDRSPGEGHASQPDATAAKSRATDRPIGLARFLALALAAGALAGVASWLAGEALHRRLQHPLLSTGGFPTAEEAIADKLARLAAVSLESTLVFASLGAVLGLALGAAGGCARRSARSALIAAAVGAPLGAAAGAAMTQLLMPIYFRFYDVDKDDLVLSLLIQGGICSAIGAAGGAALGVGVGGRSLTARTLLGGLLGGVAGVAVYQVVGALVFPLDQTTKPISATWASRLFASLSVTVLASAGAARCARQPASVAPPPGVPVGS